VMRSLPSVCTLIVRFSNSTERRSSKAKRPLAATTVRLPPCHPASSIRLADPFLHSLYYPLLSTV
jgi:hypothetical protein